MKLTSKDVKRNYLFLAIILMAAIIFGGIAIWCSFSQKIKPQEISFENELLDDVEFDLPAGHTMQNYKTEEVLDVSCEQHDDCQTPAEYMLMSRCPMQTICLNQKCAVVCPQLKNENSEDPEMDTSDWRTYTNKEYGFEIKYPKEAVKYPYEVNIFGEEAVVISIPTFNDRVLEKEKKVEIILTKNKDECSAGSIAGNLVDFANSSTIQLNGKYFYREIRNGVGENYHSKIIYYSISHENKCIAIGLNIALLDELPVDVTYQEFSEAEELEFFNQMLSTFRFLDEE